MRIEIFVVLSAKPNKPELEIAKRALIRLFGGLTIIPNCKGFWLNKNGKIEKDLVEIWLVYADFPQIKEEADRIHVESKMQALTKVLSLIKQATHQKSQAYALNNKIYFI